MFNKWGGAPPCFFYTERIFIFKIKYIPTGNIFVLPKKDAELLKEKSPQDYIILEKNGKKFKDKIPQKIESDSKSILSKIIDKEPAWSF